MIREELYYKTVDILVAAYFNDTLEHGNCYACAVGNIIAANMNLSYCTDTKGGINKNLLYWDGFPPYSSEQIADEDLWYDAIQGGRVKGRITSAIKAQVEATGYTPHELANLEKAFEGVKITSSDEYMFNGLMAAIEALDQIHENTDTVLQQQSKARFVKTALP